MPGLVSCVSLIPVETDKPARKSVNLGPELERTGLAPMLLLSTAHLEHFTPSTAGGFHCEQDMEGMLLAIQIVEITSGLLRLNGPAVDCRVTTLDGPGVDCTVTTLDGPAVDCTVTRLDGPAVDCTVTRLDGPAVDCIITRLDGPAVDCNVTILDGPAVDCTVTRLDGPAVDCTVTRLGLGFEGYMSVELDSDQMADLYHKLPSLTFATAVNNVSGVLKLKELSSSSLDLVGGKLQQRVHLMSMMLAIQEMDSLRERVSAQHKRNKFWRKMRERVHSKLNQEAEKYGDILIMNITDVYRNLPTKLLMFHNWLYNHINASNVLKTDDDCFVNIGSVMSALDEIDKRDRDMWWGSFRDQWLVEQWGKWSELTYTADIYPRFACGVGNVVSRGIHTWLSQNVNNLKTYQGEDISMGIWMSAVQLSYIKDDRWKCDKNCSANSLAIPELSPQEVKSMWTFKKTCGDPCGCGAGG
ncbi:UDP-GalNAc:beta-1,3-N-acetylgalactosaminyltransferase 2-like [Ylistrum balloti]|uniref:UDP-GalNAc:beta-1, 3-N-acetylgalactosaminyltransferase 2-like n=1 Tax=Ylistrum balloti TaxID=509963 RepID=UPI00290594C2|nr:UDP-GalNAc:beta-1,3-N-acetylgalactosaminyltransferase 2-like [Ylistrum balloti]